MNSAHLAARRHSAARRGHLPATMGMCGAAALLALLTLSGCGNDDALITLPGAEDVNAMYVYVANQDDDTISAYEVDLDSGGLTEIGSPGAAGDGPEVIAVHPTGEFLYVTNNAGGSDTVSGYEIDPDSGELNEIAGSPWAAGDNPIGIAIHPDGEWIVLANSFDSEVDSYALDADTGEMNPALVGSDTTPGDLPQDVMFHPDGDFIYATANGTDFYRLDFTAADGGVARTQIYNHPDAVEIGFGDIDPSGSFIFASDVGLDNLLVVEVVPGDGSLTEANNPSISSNDASPNEMAVDPSGGYLYVSESAQVEALEIGADGTLTPLADSPYARDGVGRGIAVDPTGQWVYAISEFQETITVFAIDAADGSLSEVSGSPFATGASPQGVAVVAISE